jgi:Mlc titration factor MtfA (ptsG expression regulator)
MHRLAHRRARAPVCKIESKASVLPANFFGVSSEFFRRFQQFFRRFQPFFRRFQPF